MQRVFQDAGDDGLADPAEAERGERDAELHGGQKLFDIVLERQRGARAGTAEGEHLLHAGLADGDQRELRSHEEAVGQDEEGHGDGTEEYPLKHGA